MNHCYMKDFLERTKAHSKVTFKRPAMKSLISGQNLVNKYLLGGTSVHVRNLKYLVGIGRKVPFPADCSNLLIVRCIASEPKKSNAQEI